MKKIITVVLVLSTIALRASAQPPGNGNGNNGNNGNQGSGYNQNHGNGNNWGQNGNGNAYGQNNGNGNGNNGNNGNNGGGSQGVNGGGGSSSSGSGVSSGADQVVNVALSNAIEITFTGNGSAMGADVNIPFTTVNHYANGVESDAQELKIRSNKNFSVAVKTNAANFTYTGNTTPAPSMPVSGVLALKVTANGTGGSVANPFSTSNYSTLTSSDQDLISSANRGGNQAFSVKYKATPGFAYPAGTYSVDVVYTATQE